jgi:hypothetical protein
MCNVRLYITCLQKNSEKQIIIKKVDGNLCDIREQNLRPTDKKSTGQALYRERRKAYTDNPKA